MLAGLAVSDCGFSVLQAYVSVLLGFAFSQMPCMGLVLHEVSGDGVFIVARVYHSRTDRWRQRKADKERKGSGILEGRGFGGCWVASPSSSGPTEMVVVLNKCLVCCWFSRNYQEMGVLIVADMARVYHSKMGRQRRRT